MHKKVPLSFLGFLLALLAHGQATLHPTLIELGKTYKNFMFRNQATPEAIGAVRQQVPGPLQPAAEFIIQTISTGNNLLAKEYLALPDSLTLKHIYIVRAINLNLREENQVDNHRLIDSLTGRHIPRAELVNNYYAMLFAAVSNKLQPFDLSKVDFRPNEYNLRDDAEKGIFFLNCLDLCGKTIWGYMNIVKPANTKKAYQFIKKFPKFNGQPYYQYNDLSFPDFEMNILQGQGPQSYKGYYLDKYYETLLSHLLCLNQERRSEKEKNDLLLGSILRDRSLYKYTRHRPTLEAIFAVQKSE
jgi:hypothetical protein